MLKKKNFKRLASLILIVSLILTISSSVFAESYGESSFREQPIQIPFSELPEEYQKTISPDAIIYKQADETYDIIQNKPISQRQEENRNPLLRYDVYTRPAPRGGTYTNFEKSKISNITFIVYDTYLPRDKVNEWICDQVPGMRDYITEMGLGSASRIATKVLAKYGLNISTGTILAIGQGMVFTLKWLNYKQVEKVSNKVENGIEIEYLTTIGVGNARVYSPWTILSVERNPRKDYFIVLFLCFSNITKI